MKYYLDNSVDVDKRLNWQVTEIVWKGKHLLQRTLKTLLMRNDDDDDDDDDDDGGGGGGGGSGHEVLTLETSFYKFVMAINLTLTALPCDLFGFGTG